MKKLRNVLKFLVKIGILATFVHVIFYPPNFFDNVAASMKNHDKLSSSTIKTTKNKHSVPNVIKLFSINGLYLDPVRSAVFYPGDNLLIVTLLMQTRFIRDKNLKVILKIRGNGIVIWDERVGVLEQVVMKTSDYTFSIVQATLPAISESTKLTYQLTVNGQVAPECDINIVNTTALHAEQSKLTARLIKCMWMPDDVETFKYIMSLIIESKYDSIYVCVFREDHELKSLLAEFDSRQKINIIELESVPHVHPGREDLRSRKQMNNDESIDEKGSFMDPALEYLLNQMYPFLVEKYRYVQAADYDHILFTRNLTFYDRVDEIVRNYQIPSHASIYLNQYWALDNKVSSKIFQNIDKYANKNSVSFLKLRDKFKGQQGETLIAIKGFTFQIRIKGDSEWTYAINLLKFLNNYADSRDQDMFRRVIVKFEHGSIYGQTIHNTRSSRVIKLCEPGGFFANGQKFVVRALHFVHYRDSYNFDLLKKAGKYIPIVDFLTWDDFKKELVS